MENSFEALRYGYQLSVPEAVQELRSGHVLIIIDHVNKAASACQALQFVNADALDAIQAVTPEEIYAVLSGERIEALQIPLFPDGSTQDMGSATTLDVRPNRHATSAYNTIQMLHALIDPATQPDDIVQPGRLAVLRSYPGGLLKKRGAAEAASDLLRIAGLEPGALLSRLDMQGESINAVLSALAEQWKSGVIALEDIIRYRKEHRVSLVTETQLPTNDAVFRLRHYQEIETGKPYLAMLLGDIAHGARAVEEQQVERAGRAPLVRLHSACATGDILGSQRCDCQAQLHAALQEIAREGRGLLLYLPQEGRGIGLSGKLQTYALQEQGYDTLEANLHLGYPIDARDYSSALEILRDLEIKHIRLMTNNPDKIDALQNGGITVENVPLEMSPNPHNHSYLQTKRQRMGHLLMTL